MQSKKHQGVQRTDIERERHRETEQVRGVGNTHMRMHTHTHLRYTYTEGRDREGERQRKRQRDRKVDCEVHISKKHIVFKVTPPEGKNVEGGVRESSRMTHLIRLNDPFQELGLCLCEALGTRHRLSRSLPVSSTAAYTRPHPLTLPVAAVALLVVNLQGALVAVHDPGPRSERCLLG